LKIKHFKKQALFNASKEKANSVNTSLRKHVAVANESIKIKEKIRKFKNKLELK
jgi:hypothetical protein